MLLLSETIMNKPVLSLRTGGQVAQIFGYVINPDNLKIEAFHCHDRLSKQDLILLYQDVRNVIGQGVIVNDHEVLSPPDVLIRLQSLLKLNFNLFNKQVITVSKHKVGKVKDFAIDNETFFIQKIYVGQNLVKNISGGQLSIDRNQVVEITDHAIIIQDLLKPSKAVVPKAVTSFSSPT